VTSSDRRRQIAAAVAQVRERIAAAALRAGRNPSEITLVGVTKTHPAEDVAAAAEAGIADVGENRVQECERKKQSLEPGIRWHLIGPLQSNKVRTALQLFDQIHTVDSPGLAQRIDRVAAELARGPFPVLIEVNLAGEPTKKGAKPDEVASLVRSVGGLSNLELRGLMAIPPPGVDPDDIRPRVGQLRELLDRSRSELSSASAISKFHELSIGMSHDFEPAIEEGATIVRVGTAIFGSRGD